jgi:MFS family permease
LAILLKLTVREPIRGAQERAGAPVAPVKYVDNLKVLMKIPTFWGVVAGLTLASFTGYGTGLWVVDFYRRTYELSYTEITVPLGILNGVVYGIGTWGGGYLTDRLGKKDKGAYAWLPGLGMLLTIPAGWALIWAPTPFWAFFWSAPFLIGLGFYLGPSFSLIQTLAPVNLRAFATAFAFFVLNLIALGFAPLWVGAVSDALLARFGEATSLRIALTTLGASSLLAALAFFWTAKKLPADWAKATDGAER